MIKYKQGDLMQAPEELIAHGCNARGVMGSGVAKLIKDKYPSAYGGYMAAKHYVGLRLGNVVFAPVEDGKIVANCITQKQYLPRGVCHADYDAIRECMKKVKRYAQDNGLRIAIPKIGAGLAGGDWSIIESILKEVFDDYDVTVYCL